MLIHICQLRHPSLPPPRQLPLLRLCPSQQTRCGCDHPVGMSLCVLKGQVSLSLQEEAPGNAYSVRDVPDEDLVDDDALPGNAGFDWRQVSTSTVSLLSS